MTVVEEIDSYLMKFFYELVDAEKKHPCWPDDVVHASAILNEEAGELTQAAIDFHYSNGRTKRLEEEAIQCGAMALRFLLNLQTYKRKEG